MWQSGQLLGRLFREAPLATALSLAPCRKDPTASPEPMTNWLGRSLHDILTQHPWPETREQACPYRGYDTIRRGGASRTVMV